MVIQLDLVEGTLLFDGALKESEQQPQILLGELIPLKHTSTLDLSKMNNTKSLEHKVEGAVAFA